MIPDDRGYLACALRNDGGNRNRPDTFVGTVFHVGTRICLRNGLRRRQTREPLQGQGLNKGVCDQKSNLHNSIGPTLSSGEWLPSRSTFSAVSMGTARREAGRVIGARRARNSARTECGPSLRIKCSCSGPQRSRVEQVCGRVRRALLRHPEHLAEDCVLEQARRAARLAELDTRQAGCGDCSRALKARDGRANALARQHLAKSRPPCGRTCRPTGSHDLSCHHGTGGLRLPVPRWA